MRPSLSCMSPGSLAILQRSIMGIFTPTKTRVANRDDQDLIDTNDLVWKDILKKYSYDFNWDHFKANDRPSLESKCERQKNDYSEQNYERFEVAMLLKAVFIEHREAQSNFSNFIKRIIEAKEFDLAQKVFDQIIKLIKDENQKTEFQQIYEEIKKAQIAQNTQKNNFLGFQSLKSLVHRCIWVPKFKTVAIIGAIASLTFGVSFAAWKNYF